MCPPSLGHNFEAVFQVVQEAAKKCNCNGNRSFVSLYLLFLSSASWHFCFTTVCVWPDGAKMFDYTWNCGKKHIRHDCAGTFRSDLHEFCCWRILIEGDQKLTSERERKWVINQEVLERAECQHQSHLAQSSALLDGACHQEGRSPHLSPTALGEARRWWKEARSSTQAYNDT